MNKSESKYFHTAEKMDQALLTLLEKKELAYITVKELCDQAGVNRSTFYLHYETIDDLLGETVEFMNRQFLEYFSDKEGTFVQQIPTASLEKLYLITPEYLSPYLTYIQEHRILFQTALERAQDLRMVQSSQLLFRHVLDPILERYGVPEEDRSYMVTFYLEGLLGIIRQWLAGNCRDSIEQITRIMVRMVRPGPTD